MVFTEFLDMVESQFGLSVVDDMIERSGIARAGVYTATGTYPHEELVGMVVTLSGMTKIPVPDLIHAYGKHLFIRLAAAFPQYVARARSAFEFFASIDGYIHVEVRKIYPDAELPRFSHTLSADGRTMELEYRSPRRFDALAYGLLEGAMAHFKQAGTIERTELADGQGSRFIVRKAE